MCRSVEPQVRQMVALCTGGDPGWEITTTGHSLGGALATVCAYDLATSKCASTAADQHATQPAVPSCHRHTSRRSTHVHPGSTHARVGITRGSCA